MELTATYQVALERLGGAAGAFAGYPVLTFNANMAVPTDDPRAVAAAIRFTDVAAGGGGAGGAAPPPPAGGAAPGPGGGRGGGGRPTTPPRTPCSAPPPRA